MNFNSIGYFQLDNLLQSRVPLLLVLLEEVDLKPWYNSLVKMHLDNISFLCDREDPVTLIRERSPSLHTPIVILDMHGQKSPDITLALEKAGYTNVYFVKNGFTGISLERKS